MVNNHGRKYISHRCPGSLKTGTPIRYAKRYDNLPDSKDNDYAWRLFNVETDLDYDVTLVLPVAKINYCPFCGKKLEIPVQKKENQQNC